MACQFSVSCFCSQSHNEVCRGVCVGGETIWCSCIEIAGPVGCALSVHGS